MSGDFLSNNVAQLLQNTNLQLAKAYNCFLSKRYHDEQSRIFKRKIIKELVYEITEESLWRSKLSQNSFMTMEEYQQDPTNQFLTLVLSGDAKAYRESVVQKTKKVN